MNSHILDFTRSAWSIAVTSRFASTTTIARGAEHYVAYVSLTPLQLALGVFLMVWPFFLLQVTSLQSIRYDTILAAMKSSPTVIICPGNGCTNIRNINWYGRLFDLLTQKHGIQCVCENFPDPHRARRNIWVPHVRCVRLLYFNIYFCNPPPTHLNVKFHRPIIVQFSRRSAWTK